MFRNSFLSAVLFAALIIVSVTSCDTKVDLLAPYKATPVIVAVLDANETDQYFRINKTFMGEGNLNSYAAIKDSVEYADGEVEASVIKLVNGQEVATWDLSPVTLDMREEGLFYDTDVKFYHFSGDLLTQAEKNSQSQTEEITFRLEATIRGELYTAETQAITIAPSNVVPSFLTLINFQANFMTGTSYNQINFGFEGLKNVARMDAKLRTYYDYDLADGTKVTGKYFDVSMGSGMVQNGQVEFSISAANYYGRAGDILSNIDNVVKIRLDSVEYIGVGANEVLSTYISVANPISDLVQVQTEYSNIDGAIGIFAFRTSGKYPKYLSSSSMKEFNLGQYTNFSCFCTNWPSDEYYCTTSPNACP